MMKYLEKRMRCARYAWAYTHIRDSSFVFAQWKTENEKKNWKCLKGLRAAARDTSIMMNWLASQSRAFSKRQAERGRLCVYSFRSEWWSIWKLASVGGPIGRSKKRVQLFFLLTKAAHISERRNELMNRLVSLLRLSFLFIFHYL